MVRAEDRAGVAAAEAVAAAAEVVAAVVEVVAAVVDARNSTVFFYIQVFYTVQLSSLMSMLNNE